MLRKLMATTNDPAVGIARLVLGLVMFPHAMQKLFGWFGGYGLDGTMGFLTGALHLPAALAWLALAAEILGSLGLIVGFLGRGAALGIAAVMAGAIVSVHAPQGFFMDWAGRSAGEGYEYHLLAIALAAVVMIKGSGTLSLDLLLQRRQAERPETAAQPAARRAA